ncbi:RNA polymerase sigma factor [Chelativorans sp. M5D2P16]|uniref:RNA polymerase sigma factor n=1 Tax=Chelativorans sp. M5D2P16 TaxID=3095678 RepID=UPI002ACA52E9|nr:sigma factor-like helix-turn-helix DNA-binding protein [Chelativorans sp. M5D2P16]MDZ5696767.1 sigma factor-like helix-turn-helix DNA-binding protein [Chelativorans sp. M5D2P16]
MPEVRSEPDQHANLSHCEDKEQLRRAILQLPHAQRQAVEMLKLREMTMKEAEAVTGMSIGALKVAVHRRSKPWAPC